jgi:exosortase
MSQQSSKRNAVESTAEAASKLNGQLAYITPAAGCLLAGVFLWAYSPTLLYLADAWNRIADYSHGWLVLPVALCFLWFRRSSRPTVQPGIHWGGLSLVVCAAALRWMSARYFVEAVDGWSLVVWIAGAVWLTCGWPTLRWALPAVAFLFFMVPLPFRVETAISVPLQRIAATGSTWLLQLFGLPALREGVRILLGPDELNIAPECSGLRMFIGVLALSYAFAVLSHRPWWDKAALLVASIPVAVIANILRITATGVLYQFSTNPEVRHSLHDNAGLFTILVAAALLASFAWYLKQLVRSVELFDGRDLVQTSS